MSRNAVSGLVEDVTRVLERRPRIVFPLTIGSLAAIAALDGFTGREITLSPFYLFPIAITAWFAGFLPSLVVGFVSAGSAFTADYVLLESVYEDPAAPYWNLVSRFALYVIVAAILVRLRTTFKELTQRTHEAREAYADLDKAKFEQIQALDVHLKRIQQTDQELKQANESLSLALKESKGLVREITLLSEMSSMLHSCESLQEVGEGIATFAPEVFPELDGAIYVAENQ
jgi:hypothetical protein